MRGWRWCRSSWSPALSVLARKNYSRPARDKGSVKMIDIITARLDAKTDSYLATLPSLRLNDVRIGDKLVREHDRMLTGGFYAEVEVGYEPHRPGERRPALRILTLREIQLSTRDILDSIAAGARGAHHG